MYIYINCVNCVPVMYQILELYGFFMVSYFFIINLQVSLSDSGSILLLYSNDSIQLRGRITMLSNSET